MAKQGNGKATYCVFDVLTKHPVISDDNLVQLDSEAALYYVKEWAKVDFRPVELVKFGGAGPDWADIKPFVKRLKGYNHNPRQNAKMYQVRLYNIDTHEEMRETELHRFIKANPERTGLLFMKKDVAEKNEWYIVVDPVQFALWLDAASRKNGVLPRIPNKTTASQRNVLDESKEKIRKHDSLFWYLATRFRKSGTCLELNRQAVKANFMLVISPISESIYSYKGVINSFQGFEDYELLMSEQYGSDLTALRGDMSRKMLSGKTVVLFTTWAWFKVGGKDDTEKWHLMDGLEGVKKTFVVVDEFHNASDTETSMSVVNNIKNFGPAKTLYMSGTPFNELTNNSGFNKTGEFSQDALIVFDLGDLLASSEYRNFKLEHHLMNFDRSGGVRPDCNFEFEYEDTVQGEGDKNNTFRRFVEEMNVIEAFRRRKTSICYMSSVKCVKVAYKYTHERFKEDDNWAIFAADDNSDTDEIMVEVEKFHKTHPDGHCVIFVCRKFVMGATIKSCDAIHFMRRIGSTEFAVQAWGRTLTLNGVKTNAGIYYYDDKSFWNTYLNFDISHEHLTHERQNDYYRNGAIVFEHIYIGMNPNPMSEDLVKVYLRKYRELNTKDSAVDNAIATGFNFDSDIDLEEGTKASSSKSSGKELFPGNNKATQTAGKDAIPRDNGNGASSSDAKKPASRKEKIMQFIKDNILNYMYFATSLFTTKELDNFARMSSTSTKCARHECSLGILFEKPEFDIYFNRIHQMKTHILGEGQWEGMCDSCRNEILTRFHSALEYTKPENYEDTFAKISHKIVSELYEKNKSLVADKQ